jgi:hypothetical protein
MLNNRWCNQPPSSSNRAVRKDWRNYRVCSRSSTRSADLATPSQIRRARYSLAQFSREADPRAIQDGRGRRLIEQSAPLIRIRPKRGEFAAGIAAHVIRRWPEADQREWYAEAMRETAELIGANLERKVPLLELPRTTVRNLRDGDG